MSWALRWPPCLSRSRPATRNTANSSVHQTPWSLHVPVQPHSPANPTSWGFTDPGVSTSEVLPLNKPVCWMMVDWVCTHPRPKNRAVNYTRHKTGNQSKLDCWRALLLPERMKANVHDFCIKFSTGGNGRQHNKGWGRDSEGKKGERKRRKKKKKEKERYKQTKASQQHRLMSSSGQNQGEGPETVCLSISGMQWRIAIASLSKRSVGPARQLLEQGEAQRTHLAGINSVVILVGVSAAALGFMRDSFFPMIHAVLTPSPEGSPKLTVRQLKSQCHVHREVWPWARHRVKTRPWLFTGWDLNTGHREGCLSQKLTCLSYSNQQHCKGTATITLVWGERGKGKSFWKNHLAPH